MKILVLDDNKNRLCKFKQKLIGNVIDCTKTAKGAINLLKDNIYDVAFLDHDLNGVEHQPSGLGTGYEVAEWLNKNKDKKPFKIIIHSFNSLGAQNMLTLLPEADYVPGIWLLDKISF